MKNILWFSEIRKENIPEVGGKGANLGEMTSVNFPIPPGFVVTSGAYFSFIDHNKMRGFINDQLWDIGQNNDRLNKASEMIKTRILSGEIPPVLRKEIMESYQKLCAGKEKYVAVRSSATAEDLPEASFAGQQSTFLNIKGPEDVVQAVKECWASLFEPRAIFYRNENKFEHMKVGLAAVVQEMVQSEVSGIVFTAEPVNSDRNTISIEAGWGLGEAVVSGSITPDIYLVDKKTLAIKSKEIAKQDWMIAKVREKDENVDVPEEKRSMQKMSDDQIVKMAEICRRIDEHYKKPQDIEFAIAEGRLYIVQSRPITTLKEEKPMAAEAKPQAGAQAAPAQAGGKKAIADAKIIVRGTGASLGNAVGKVKLVPTAKDIGRVEKGDILVTDMTTPDFVPAMKKAAAIVTNAGGRTCHAAIVSRELGIPCIVGTKTATDILKDGMLVSVDAVHGLVYEGAVDLGGGAAASGPTEGPAGGAIAALDVAPITGTKIYVNLAEKELAEKVAREPVDGVGLLRAEFMIAEIGEHPKKMLQEGRGDEYVNKLAEGMRTFAAAFYPRPVVYRATDFKTNEYRNLKGGEKFEPQEANPMMGWRGCGRYITEPEVFKLELKAIKKVREEYDLKNLWLMIPFVRRIGEVRAIRDMLREMGIHRTRDFKLWIMVEVPSTVFLIDEFCKEGIDGVSIGSNDLTQLILGIDRDNETMASAFDERNHAVLKAIEIVVRGCAKHGVTCSICGQAPSVYPEFAERLVDMGITSMSVNPDAIMRTRKIVAAAERRVILKRLAALQTKVEELHNEVED